MLQQSFHDFELVIGDDGSDDGSSDRLQYWSEQDPRIRLFRRETPSGPAASSNWVVELSRAPLVARMDADDLAHPLRLERQLAIFQGNPQVVLAGSIWTGIDSRNRPVRPPDMASLLACRPFTAPFAHGSIMISKSAFEDVGGYRQECDYWEDNDLFLRLAKIGKIKVSVEPLYSYRFSASSNRLHAQPSRLEKQLALQLLCKEAWLNRGDYEHILHSSGSIDLSPPLRVFQQRAGLSIWAGNRSTLIFEWFKRHPWPRNKWDMAALLFLVWAAVSPKSLRWLLVRMVDWRNQRANAKLGPAKVIDWN